jgi:hypothetical protein
MLKRTGDFLQAAHPVQAIRVLGVKFILTEGQMGADAAAAYPIAYSEEGGYVYENPEPLPRALVVHNVVQATSAGEALAYFEKAELDPRQTVVLESEAPPLPGTPQRASTASIATETPQRIEIAVNAAADGYLVLLDTYYPGWQATVDGHPTTIYRADYIGRAVFVPAGQHTVIFEYRPLSFRLGVGLLLLVMVTFAVVALLSGRLSWSPTRTISVTLR